MDVSNGKLTKKLIDDEVPPSPVESVLRARLMHTLDIAKMAGKKIALAVFIWSLGYFNLSLMWLFFCVFVYTYFSEKAKQRSVVQNLKRHSAKSEDALKNVMDVFRLSGSQVPSWIYFPDVEKADWVNNILQQLWPFIGEYVKTVIIEEVQPSIRSSSVLLSNFSFTDLDLGERPPQVAGVKVYDENQTRRSEVVMDFQLIVDSDCNIGVSVNRLQAGICNLRVSGTLRVEFQPLLKTMPLVGAISAAFVKDPLIDFDLTHLANLLDFPGFDVMLRGAISDSIGAMFVLPEKYVVKLCPEIDLKDLRFPLPKGIVRIHILRAENLEEKDRRVLGIGGGSDPYVTIKVGHTQKFKTKTISHNLNPTWNETFDAHVTDLEHTNIEFILFDDDGPLNKADYLGCASLPAKTVYEYGCIDEAIILSEVETGRLHVRLEWFDLSSNPEDLKEALELSSSIATSHSAFLSIYVDGAQHLPQQEAYNPSPMLKISVPGKEAVKTKIISQTNNPVWEENFQFLLRQPHLDLISFELKSKRNRALRTLNKTCARIKQGVMTKAIINVVSGNSSGVVLEDSFPEGDSLGMLKYPIRDIFDAFEMNVHRPFSLQHSGAESVLNLRLSLRVLKRRSQVDAASAVKFSIISPKPLTRTNKKKVADENQNLSIVENTTTPSGSEMSINGSNTSIEFTDKTLQSFYEGSPAHPRPSRSDLGVSRTASIASEISNLGEIGDLRKRLNAKLKENGESNDGLGRVKLTIRYRKNTLVVLVICATNLMICDEDKQTSDPYVRVFIMPHKGSRKKTKVVKNNLNPKFDEKLEFSVSPNEVARKRLNVTVKNQTGFLSSEKVLMGQVIINLSELDLSQPNTSWYNLKLPDET